MAKSFSFRLGWLAGPQDYHTSQVSVTLTLVRGGTTGGKGVCSNF